MFTLVTDRSKYFRIKKGQSGGEIERVFNIPVNGRVYAGRIIEMPDNEFVCYTVEVGDTYRSIALKFGVAEDELRIRNGNKPVYPTCKLFVPRK